MPTVLEVLRKTAEFLGRKEVPSPRLEAELLLAGALGCKRLDLYLRFDQPLTEAQLVPLRDQVARRAKREPLQYITGRAGFLDFTVACDRRALIPRPETEELAELVFTRITSPPAAALDLGTGTGVLACAMARRWAQCKITAVDMSEDSLSLARANATTLDLGGRIQFVLANWFAGVPASEGGYGVIVSNPPYLTEAEWTAAQPEVRDWEPRGALVAQDNGLADLRHILAEAPAHLHAGGLLALETGIAQHPGLTALAAKLMGPDARAAYASTESLRDLSGRERFFLAWRV
jgi:release factor glutamine methyltransferase